MPHPLGEEELNQAADRIYGKGYSIENQLRYEEGLNYSRLKNFKQSLIAGTDHEWIEEVIEEKEGTVDLLPKSLVNEYNVLNNQGLNIEAYNLLVPVGRWRLGYLIKEDCIDVSTIRNTWIIDKPYLSETGLEFY